MNSVILTASTTPYSEHSRAKAEICKEVTFCFNHNAILFHSQIKAF